MGILERQVVAFTGPFMVSGAKTFFPLFLELKKREKPIYLDFSNFWDRKNRLSLVSVV